MYSRTILIGLCLLGSCAWAADEESVIGIGTRFPPYPQGCKEGGGWLEGKNEGGVDLAALYIVCDSKTYLSLNRLTHKDDDKHKTPHWEIVDFVVLPELKKGESISDPFDCTNMADGKTGVITIGNWRNTPEKTYASKITYAVRVNSKQLKIEELSPNQVKCEFFEDRD